MTTQANSSSQNAPDFQHIKLLFNTIVDLPANERMTALSKLTDDPAVIARVVSILTESATHFGTIAQAISAASADLAAEMEAAELAAGDTVGAWKLIEEIGRGGMGAVFLVERSDGHFQQRAALKLLSGLASAKAQEHLARERQILAALSHPNIARLLDGGATPRGRPYLVLEHVNGQAIDKYCSAKKLSQLQVITLFIAVCKTVAFAHQQLVVHCDLKPSNILITAEGRPVLLDFGVSRLLSDAAKDDTKDDAQANANANAPTNASTTQTAAAYTPRYASPEQKAGERVGMATDVYSLGLLLAELLGVKITANEALKLDVLNADVAAIISHATASSVANRYVSVDALALDLQRTLHHQAVAARPATAVYISKKFIRRNWPWLVGAAAFVATVSVFSWRTVVERDNAVKAEIASREVKDYMISVFQGADPEVSGQRDLPVSALLDAGRERMATRLKDQPATRAEMSGILGSVYQNIGKREQALTLFDEAIQIERSNNRPAVLADLIYKKAYTLYDMEDFSKAEPLAKEALKLRQQIAPESVEVVEAQRLAGMIASYLGNNAEAEPILRKAVAMAVQLRGESSVEAAKAYLSLGSHLITIDGGAPEAAISAQKARAIFKKNFGVHHFLYIDTLEVSALSLAAFRKYSEALPMAKEVSEKRGKLYGELSNQNGFGLFTYGNMLEQAGFRNEAILIFERCLAIQEKLDGRGTFATAAPMELLARAKRSAGIYDEALAIAKQVLVIRAKALPMTNPELLRTQFEVGRLQRLTGSFVEAERLSRTALDVRTKTPNTQKLHLLHSQLEMSALYRQQGKFDAAFALIASAEALPVFTKPERKAIVALEKGRLAVAQKQHDVGLKFFVEAERLSFEEYGVAHPDAWLIKLNRAELLAELGQREPARELAKQIAINAKPSIALTGDFAKRLAKLGA